MWRKRSRPQQQMQHRQHKQQKLAPATEEAEGCRLRGSAADVATSKLSGSITMVGSTSMEKFSNALMEAFMQANPGVTVSPEFVGSSAVLKHCLQAQLTSVTHQEH